MKKILTTLLTTLSLSTLSCSYAGQPQPTLNTTTATTESKMQLDLSQQEQWCIGRYTFQLPKGAKIMGSIDKYNTFTITSQTNSSLKAFRDAIQKVKQEYTSEDSIIVDETPETQQNRRMRKIVWGKLEPTNNKGLIKVFAFVYDQSTGTLFSITGSYSEEYKEKSLERIHHLVNNLQGRANNTVPTQAGVCLQNGFIANEGKEYRFSRQSITFEYPAYPSIQISLETEATYEQLDNLIERTKRELKEDHPLLGSVLSHIKTIQKGKKAQTGVAQPLTGYEWIIDSPLKGHHGINASWEHTGTKDSSLDTLIQLEVETAKDDPSINSASIPPKVAIFMYNQILNSIQKF